MLSSALLGLIVGISPVDYNFQYATERFVYEQGRESTEGSRPLLLKRFLPIESIKWLRLLDSNSGMVRDEATAILVERYDQPNVVRLVVWGSFSETKSPEVRNRCQAIIYQCYICDVCLGRKVCLDCDGKKWIYNKNDNGLWCSQPYCMRDKCLRCDGTGEAKQLTETINTPY